MTCHKKFNSGASWILNFYITGVLLLISDTGVSGSPTSAAGQQLGSQEERQVDLGDFSSERIDTGSVRYAATGLLHPNSRSAEEDDFSTNARAFGNPRQTGNDNTRPSPSDTSVLAPQEIGATARRSHGDSVTKNDGNLNSREGGGTREGEGGEEEEEDGRRDMVSGIGGVVSREVSSGHASALEEETIEDLLENDQEEDEENEVIRSGGSGAGLYSGSGDGSAAGLEVMVRNLQAQVEESRTSQARTRSILNVIQEKQAQQDEDLALLKNELQSLRTSQEADHGRLEEAQVMVSDTAWAIRDLKHSQDQLHADFSTFKHYQEQQNETVRALEEHMDVAQEHRYGYRDLITRLHIELEHMKSSMGKDRETMFRLKTMLNSLERANKEMTSKHEHLNNIPTLVSNSESGDSSGGDAINPDHIYSAQEELDNSIGQNLVDLYKHKHHMHMQIENLNKRFLHYDAEMAKLHTSYFNLSLQISSVENKVLSQQHNRFDSDMTKLQSSFINFTQQMLNLEKWHMSTKTQLNTSYQNEVEISQLISSVDNNQMRIQALENIAIEYREESNLRRMYQDQLSSMNHSVQAMRLRLRDHKTKATHNFDGVDEGFSQVKTDLKKHHKRLLEVEVRVLNESLYQCRKRNADNIQDMKLDKLKGEMVRVDDQLSDHTGHLSRHDRSLSAIYNEVKGNNRMIGEVMSQSKVLFDLVPRTKTLEDEIRNLLQHLPRDCSEIHQDESTQSDLHLIRPEGAISSIRAYCEIDSHQSTWLVIQRRESGVETFARSWEEYKSGFGSAEKEFWIGNDNLHILTAQKQYRIHIDMWDLNDVYYFVEYDFFRVEDESTHFRLSIDGYHGNATDAMRYSNYMPFSTMDRDNDVSSTHCAKFYTAGWWYKHCHYSNLNGRYTVGIVWFNHDFDEWVQMKKTVMKIQPVIVEDSEEQSSGA